MNPTGVILYTYFKPHVSGFFYFKKLNYTKWRFWSLSLSLQTVFAKQLDMLWLYCAVLELI